MTAIRRPLRIGDRVSLSEGDRQMYGVTGHALTVAALREGRFSQIATIQDQCGVRHDVASAFLSLHDSQIALDALADALANANANADANATAARRERDRLMAECADRR